MNCPRVIVLTASIIVTLSCSSTAQWLQTSGPFGAYVTDMAASGNNLIAGAENGIYYSTDNGSHWSPSLLVRGGASALAAGGSSQVWAGANNGVFLSTDKGVSWSDVTTPMVNDYVNAIAATPSFVLVAEYGGLFRSTDLGTSWENIGAGLPTTYANALLIDGSTIWAGLQNSPHALYRTTDTGGTWQYSDSGLVPKDVRSILRFGGRLFSSTWGGGVFVSADSGRTWTPANNGITGSIIPRLFPVGTRIGAFSDYGVFISADTGKSWTPAGQLPMAGYGNSSFASIGSTLFAGGVDGVHVSTDGGALWTLRNDGMTGAGVTALVSQGGALAAGTFYNGVAISTDGGTSWTYSNAGLPGHILYTLLASGNLLWEGGNIGVYRSTDRGANWTAADNGFGGYNPTSSFISAPPLLYSCGSLGIFTTSDSGAQWKKISTGLPVKPVYSMLLVSASGPMILAGTIDSLYRSTDGGGSWTASKKFEAEDMIRFGADIYAATQSGVMISTDEGITWNSANQNINPLDCHAFAISGNNLFLGAAAGLFRTTGKGAGWIDVSSGLPRDAATGYPRGEVYSLLVEGSYLYAGVGFDGVWKRPLSEIVTGVAGANLLPARPVLEQNYPNPFNPVTTIRYGLPKSMRVTLSVYNTLGQHVVTLMDGIQDAGYHEMKFDGSGLASGVYVYRIQAGGFVQSKKVLLLR